MYTDYTTSAGLRQLRQTCQLSQEQVASCLNVSRTTYGAYERGERLIPKDRFTQCSRIYKVTSDPVTSDPSSLPESAARGSAPHFSFTEEEQDLLLGFRQLDAAARSQILSMIHFELEFSLPDPVSDMF